MIDLISLHSSHNHKLSLHTWMSPICTHEERNNVSFLRFSIYCIFSLFFNYINNVKENNPYWLPVSLFDKVLTSHRHIISSFVFKSNLSRFIAIIKSFQNFAVIANWNTADVWCDKTMHMHNYIVTSLSHLDQRKPRGRKGTCVRQGREDTAWCRGHNVMYRMSCLHLHSEMQTFS
jgi:hypothetical protein